MAWRVGLFLGSFLLLCGATILFPAIDLRTSAAFYVPGHEFPIGGLPLVLAVHRAGMRVLVVAIAAAGVALILARRWRAGIFLLLALALGPGLVVNGMLKDHWGRARPAQIQEFGGHAHFTPAFVPSDQCETNCSFPAGDPANGFVLVAAGFLATRRRRRRALIAAGVGAGLLLGFMRVAGGGHFLSDVLASVYLFLYINWLLY
ncbi:MAG: phosphatase PAP2 family protein, partial [Stellaceae bacterium]